MYKYLCYDKIESINYNLMNYKMDAASPENLIEEIANNSTLKGDLNVAIPCYCKLRQVVVDRECEYLLKEILCYIIVNAYNDLPHHISGEIIIPTDEIMAYYKRELNIIKDDKFLSTDEVRLIKVCLNLFVDFNLDTYDREIRFYKTEDEIIKALLDKIRKFSILLRKALIDSKYELEEEIQELNERIALMK